MSTERNEPRSARRRRVLCAAAGALATASLASLARAERAPARAIDIIGAPSNLGLRPLRPGHIPGARRAPGVLRAHRVVERLGARDRGDVEAPEYAPDVDAATGYRNGANLAAYTPRLADRIGASIDDSRFTLVLGGDCSVLLGGALALKRRGRYGLLFIDGHSDFYFTRKPRAMAAAGMDLALATGHGPDALAGIDGLKPYVREDDTVVFAYRDFGTPDEVETERFLGAAFERHPIEDVRGSGIAASMREALRRLEHADLRGFWIHVDVDVLDPKLMPAVDSPDPGGLTFEELEDILALALASPRVAGMELDIYDPDLDPDGHLAATLVALLARAFARAGRFGVRENA
jgi:arginase